MNVTSAAWRLDWRDYQGHHVGNRPPPCRHKRFKTQEAAFRELDRLRTLGGDVLGFVSPAPVKLRPEQADFGFPTGGPPRMTD